LSRDDAITRYFSLKAQGTVISYLKSPQAQQFANTPTVKSILEVVNSREYIQTLVTMLGDSSWFVRQAALEVVEKLKPAPLQDFISLMIEDPNPHIRKSSIATTASYANSFSITFLKNLVENRQDWREGGWALVQLADLDRAYTLNMINSKLTSLSWPENYYLIRALDRIETRNATDLLVKLAQTDEYAQLSTVLESLVNRDPVSKDFYIDKLGTKDPAITTIIASKFALMKDPQTVPALIGSYHNFEAPKDLEAMISIITALDSINSPAAIEFLQKQTDSRYYEIRKASRHALQHISGQNFTPDTTATLPRTRTDFQTDGLTEQPRVRVETTRGNFELILYPEKAPLTVANFLELVNTGFYDGIYFHRVVPGFVIQGGDPRGDGWGGPDYAIPCEYNDIFYDRGVLGMAHAGKDTGGSQFFITHTPQPHLNGKHTAFGRVISGMSVVDQIDMYDHIQKAYIVN
jgi:peptidyl-prolyl cis-trans isomerase B (cyclophilin B)